MDFSTYPTRRTGPPHLGALGFLDFTTTYHLIRPHEKARHLLSRWRDRCRRLLEARTVTFASKRLPLEVAIGVEIYAGAAAIRFSVAIRFSTIS